MGVVFSCSDDQEVFHVTQPLKPRLREEYDSTDYQPQGGYYQPRAKGYQPQWYQQDNQQEKSEVPRPRSKAVPYQNQDYYDIREQLIEQGALFVDPEFPPTPQSLYWSKQAPRYIKWKRPHVC